MSAVSSRADKYRSVRGRPAGERGFDVARTAIGTPSTTWSSLRGMRAFTGIIDRFRDDILSNGHRDMDREAP
jgi:hypothetical protein